MAITPRLNYQKSTSVDHETSHVSHDSKDFELDNCPPFHALSLPGDQLVLNQKSGSIIASNALNSMDST